MIFPLRALPAFFVIALGGALTGCLSGLVDPVDPVPAPDPLVGAWRTTGQDFGFQYQFLDSSRMVVERRRLNDSGNFVTQTDTLPIVFEPGGFFFRWRYKGEFGRHYCLRKGDTLILGVAAMGTHQEIYPRVAMSGRTKANAAFGMWETLLCPGVYCRIDTAVIDTNGYLRSKAEQNKFGTTALPVVFQDEIMTVLVPESQSKYPFVHMVRNDTLWLLETGTSCGYATDPCLPNSRLKLVRR